MKSQGFLYGKSVYLRALSEQDAYGNYKCWFNDEEVCKGNSHHKFPQSEDDLKKYILDSNSSVNRITLGIITIKDNVHIGNITLQNINYFSRTAEFAIIIGEREYWGMGYGKEAAILIIKHGFNVLNLHRIYCGTFANNIGMNNMAKTLGFKQEGIRREADYKDGVYVDIIEYGLLKNEFKL